MTTGVVFAKFGAPNPRVLFSRHALVADHRDGRKLTFRLGNERDGHIIVEARIRVTLAFDEPEPHGGIRRRLCDLRLERTMSPLFQLSWSVFHPIDDASPLYALGPDDLQARNVTLIVTFTGVDDSLSQSVHARRAYGATDILFDRRFADILVDDGQGGRYVDYRRFHDHVPASARAAASGAA
jgi:inward rectifier potassium channel